MTLLVDENIDWRVTAQLRSSGHQVVGVANSYPGIPDDQVLELAVQHQAVDVTDDKDFGELVFQRGLTHSGVTLLRLEGLAH